MSIKTITRNGRDWAWPEYDTELIKVFDQVDDIDRILPYVKDFSVCVQAGGACGVWPARLCEHFEQVITFEPDWLNFQCLTRNAPDAVKVYGALMDIAGEAVCVRRHDSEQTNAGAGYLEWWFGGSQLTSTFQLDNFDLPSCGLVQLDVEGEEGNALHGAWDTVRRCKPVVVIEEKPLPQGGDHLAARRLLESWGYVERERFHRDVLFTWGES